MEGVEFINEEQQLDKPTAPVSERHSRLGQFFVKLSIVRSSRAVQYIPMVISLILFAVAGIIFMKSTILRPVHTYSQPVPKRYSSRQIPDSIKAKLPQDQLNNLEP